MSAGRRVPAQISRGLNHPARRGQRIVAIARRIPIPENNSKFESGTSQTKCRLIMYSRLLAPMLRHSTLVPTSSHPAASPQQAESASTSSAPSRLGRATVRADPAATVSPFAGVVVLKSPGLTVSTTGIAVVDDHPVPVPRQ